MSFLPAIFRSDRGKADLHLLFLAALAGQALTLAVGLWLEQKLLDSASRWAPLDETAVRGKCVT